MMEKYDKDKKAIEMRQAAQQEKANMSLDEKLKARQMAKGGGT